MRSLLEGLVFNARRLLDDSRVRQARSGAASLAERVLPDRVHERLRVELSAPRRRFRSMLRDDDVFVVGHPKSGNTWLSLMLAVLVEDGFDADAATVSNVRRFLPAIHNRDRRVAEFERLPSPRMFRNEQPVFPELYPRTVYIVRDPRAVYVSYYHHALHDTAKVGWSLDDAVDELLEHGCFEDLEPWLVRWDRHAGEWLDRRDRQPVHVVRYEDLQEDARKALVAVVDFLGLEVDPEHIDEAVERASFRSMRAQEEEHGAEPYSGTKGERGYFTRKGTVDSWRDELSERSARRIEEAFAPVMRQLGYAE
jgi:Sulfotransferase domain